MLKKIQKDLRVHRGARKGPKPTFYLRKPDSYPACPAY